MMDLEDWKLMVFQAFMLDVLYIVLRDDLEQVFSGGVSLADAGLVGFLLMINGAALYALVTELTG